MKEKLQQIRKLLLLTLLGMTLAVPAQAQAADYSYTLQENELSAKVQVDGSGIPDGNEYTVILTAEEGTPMPEDAVLSEDGTKRTVSKTVVNGGEVSFWPITYTAPGEYRYTLHQEAQARDHFTYDTTVYHVSVWIFNDFENGGLKAMITGYRDDETSKAEEFIFQNHYSRPADPSNSSDDGGDGGGSHVDDTTVVQTVVTPVVPTPPAQVVLPPTTQEGAGPQTGDEANVMLWAAGALLGAAALIIIAFLGKKNRKA